MSNAGTSQAIETYIDEQNAYITGQIPDKQQPITVGRYQWRAVPFDREYSVDCENIYYAHFFKI